jgi:hypothetical protein
MVAEVNEQSTVSRRAFPVGMVATGVAMHTKDAPAEDDDKSLGNALLQRETRATTQDALMEPL